LNRAAPVLSAHAKLLGLRRTQHEEGEHERPTQLNSFTNTVSAGPNVKGRRLSLESEACKQKLESKAGKQSLKANLESKAYKQILKAKLTSKSWK
jgi:hypothetical protein